MTSFGGCQHHYGLGPATAITRAAVQLRYIDGAITSGGYTGAGGWQIAVVTASATLTALPEVLPWSLGSHIGGMLPKKLTFAISAPGRLQPFAAATEFGGKLPLTTRPAPRLNAMSLLAACSLPFQI